MIAGAAHATSVTLTLTEPSGIARVNDPVTSGVPISTADAAPGVKWALFDGATEIPVQTKVLPGIRTPWLLLDFRSSMAANATKSYQLISQNPVATQPNALVITKATNGGVTKYTVVNGPLKVVVNATTFNFLDEVWLDKNHNGSWATSERLVNSSTTDNMPLVTADNLTKVGRRAPLSVAWEDSGATRATLRIDGYYAPSATPSDTVLRYTTRITFYAGQTYVGVKHVLRNSFRANTKYVKVKSARLQLGGNVTWSRRASRSGDEVFVHPDTGKAVVQLIPPTQTITTAYAPRVNSIINVDTNGGMIIADESYHGASFRFEFCDTALNATETTNRTTRFKNRLFATAPSSWYAQRGAFGVDNFGTYDDEKTASTNWGWAWPNTTPSPNPPQNYQCWSNEHALPRPADTYYPSWSEISCSDDLESDDLGTQLLMYARTGQRTYLDRADRWARYAGWEFAWRTDNVAFEDGGFWSQYSLNRPRLDVPAGTFTAADENFILFNCNWNGSVETATATGKDDATHTWNGGLIDYYYMTGDRDALTAAIDVAEHSKRMQEWRSVSNWNAGNIRAQARGYLNSMRVWEATNNSYWRSATDKLKQMFLLCSFYDARGFYYQLASDYTSPSTIGARYPNGKIISPFMEGLVSHVLYRDWQLTGNDSLRTRAIALADFAYNYGAQKDSSYTGDYMIMDSPNPGDVQHHSYSIFRTGTLPWYSYSSGSGNFVDALDIGYRLTGNTCYLSRAKQLWERASKYDFQYRFADATHVGRWANSLACWNSNYLLFPNNGDLMTTQYYFHDAALVTVDGGAPAPVTDLQPTLGLVSSVIAWTAPGDDGNTGTATEYDLRYSPFTITEGNFAAATSIPTAAPSAAGTPECAETTDLIQCTTYFFALRTKDECGNWSAISNLPSAATKCGTGVSYTCNGVRAQQSGDPEEASAMPRTVEFAVAGSNPVRDNLRIQFGVPANRAGEPLHVVIYDIAGRNVRTLHEGPAVAGRHTLTWDRMTDAGGRARTGAYFVSMRLGSENRARKLVVIQ